MTAMALATKHDELGATYGEELGCPVVTDYGDPRAGVIAIRERAGVADLSHRGWLRVTGADRVRFLQAMVTGDVAARTAGQGLYACLLNDRGRVVADLGIFVAPDAIYLDVEAPARATVPAFFDRYIIMDDVTITDETDNRVLLGVYGPGARQAVEAALGEALPELGEWDHRAWTETRAMRRDRVGAVGFELCVPTGAAARIHESLRGAGALPVGNRALEMLRVEAGIPRAFLDVDEKTIMLEAGLERFISREKGCYLGQEVIVRALDRGGIKRTLKGLRWDGEVQPTAGSPVLLGDKEIGRVSSVVPSPSSPGSIGLAVLQRDGWEPGTAVTVDGTVATVTALPHAGRS